MEISNEIWMYLILSFVFFCLLAWVAAGIFQIPKLIRYQKAQAKILAMIAQQNGCDTEQLRRIIADAEKVSVENEQFKGANTNPAS